MNLLAKHNIKVIWLWPSARDYAVYTRATRVFRRLFHRDLSCDQSHRLFDLAQELRESFKIPPEAEGLTQYLSADFNITHAVLIQSLDPRLQWPSRWKESDLEGRAAKMTEQAKITFLSRFVYTPLNFHTAQVHIWTKGKYVIHSSAEILIRGNLGYWANAASMANMAYHCQEGQYKYDLASGKCTNEEIPEKDRQYHHVPTQLRPKLRYDPHINPVTGGNEEFRHDTSAKGQIKLENLILDAQGKLRMFKFMLSREKRSLDQDTLEWAEFPEVFQGKAGIYTDATEQLIPNYAYAEKIFNKIYLPEEEHSPKDMRIS